jgi:peptide/nickel transport system substrate-binding protein
MRAWAALVFLLVAVAPAGAGHIDPPMFADAVAAGTLPPVDARIPTVPAVADIERIGHYGGTMQMLMGRSKDIRMMVVYGYARLVGYDRNFSLGADVLASYEIDEGRIFTFHLRKGHRWSDGHPFTAEDFRYYWEDVISNAEITPSGPPMALRMDGEAPLFEVIDETTVRFSWSKPNPFFLPALAAARPLYLYRPAHYMKQFHARYADLDELQHKAKEEGQRNWVALHYRKSHQYKNDNPDLPSLQPWVLTTKPPAERFIFVRNPYYHRVDSEGRQLPYIDRVIVTIANSKLIPAKSGAGEVDLQARNLQFKNYTFLKMGEKRNDFSVRLWRTAKGAQIALYPNLNVKDPVWRRLLREADFRRALSLAVDRHEINQVIFYGLAIESGNTVLQQSPLYRPEYGSRWAKFDIHKANRMLDGLGLTERNNLGIRLLPDGRPAEIIVELAGEESEQTDVLELIHDSWMKIGIKLYTKPLQREVFRNRIFTGSTLMSVWFGIENGIPTPDSSPHELAPTSQQQYQWPKWGQYFETGGRAGEPVDLEVARTLAGLNSEWRVAADGERKRDIWHRMLDLYSDQVFSIGLVCGVRQPVVVSDHLRNVPKEGIYNWSPGAHFGVHRPDTFWFAGGAARRVE